MKFVNKTEYQSDDLLKIFQKCISLTKYKGTRKIIVTYNYSLFGKPICFIGGYARCGRKIIVIKLPECEQWNMNTTLCCMDYKSQVVAMIFLHEIGHLMGVKHNDNCTIEQLYLFKIKEVFTNEKYILTKT